MDRRVLSTSIESHHCGIILGGRPVTRLVLTLRDDLLDETQFLLDSESTPQGLLLALLQNKEVLIKQNNRVERNALIIETVITWPTEETQNDAGK